MFEFDDDDDDDDGNNQIEDFCIICGEPCSGDFCEDHIDDIDTNSDEIMEM